MKLENIKFGDKFITRDGRVAIVIGEHKTIRRHWYDFIAFEEDVPMLGNSPVKFSANDEGIAFEGFDWLDIIIRYK